MKSHYKRLGDYIREVNVRNRDLEVTRLLGVSIQKVFMPSIANTIGTDMATYKIVEKGQFGYGPVTSRNGDKVSIALLTEYENAIVSQAYTVFEVVDRDKLLPEYLMMWFRRAEFDRYARFKSHGSAREIFDWAELCDVTLPIPAIEVQREIVAEYEALSRRIAINEQICEKLEATAQALYRKMFIDNIDPENLPHGWRMGTIGEFGVVITGKTPSSECPEDFGETMQFVTPGDFIDGNRFILSTGRYLSEIGLTKLKSKIIRSGDIMVTCIGSDMGKVKIANEDCISNQQINSIRINNSAYSDYLYIALSNLSLQLKSMALGSSTMPMLNKTDFEKIALLIPDTSTLKTFAKLSGELSLHIKTAKQENMKLIYIKGLLLSKLATN